MILPTGNANIVIPHAKNAVTQVLPAQPAFLLTSLLPLLAPPLVLRDNMETRLTEFVKLVVPLVQLVQPLLILAQDVIILNF